jgi:hypothetical protein
MNQNTKPKRYNYHIYDLRLCKMDADGNFELHPNGQPKLYNYNSDGLSDVHYSEMCNLNDGEEMEEYSNWVEPIPMEDKPINRANLTTLLRQLEIDLVSMKHNCYDYDLSKDIGFALYSLTQAIQVVDKDEEVQDES